MTSIKETRENEAKFREMAAKHPRDSEKAEEFLGLAEELRVIAERRERMGWS